MSLKLRLARAGTKKRPYYHVVVADARSPRDGRFIERIGTYDPKLEDTSKRVNLVTERAQHWLSVGAQPTDRVLRFLDVAGIRKRDARMNPNKGQPGTKRLEREEAKKTAAEEKAKAADEAKQAAADAKKAAAEAAAAPPPPAEEPAVEEPAAEPEAEAEQPASE